MQEQHPTGSLQLSQQLLTAEVVATWLAWLGLSISLDMNAGRGSHTAGVEDPPQLVVPRFSSFEPIASGSTSDSQRSRADKRCIPSTSTAAASEFTRSRRRDSREGPSRELRSSSRRERKVRGASEEPKNNELASDGGRSPRRNHIDDHYSRHHRASRSHDKHRHSHGRNASDSSRRRRSRSPTSSSHRHSQRSESDVVTPTFECDLFFTDTKGDFDALRFGQDQSKIPRAHRAARSHAAIGSASRLSAASTASDSRLEPPDRPILPSPVHANVLSQSDPLQQAEDFIGINSPDEAFAYEFDHDPFDPNLPYVKRDPRYEQVGGGTKPQATDLNTTDLALREAQHPRHSTLDLLKLVSRRNTPTGLQELPVELLHRILVLSHSSSFPLISRRFRQACNHASITDKVDYILGRWVDSLIDYISSKPNLSKPRRATSKHLSRVWQETRASWRDFADEISKSTEVIQDLTGFWSEHGSLHIVDFAAEFGICTTAVLDQVVVAATASTLTRPFILTPSPGPLLETITSLRELIPAALSQQSAFSYGRVSFRPRLPKRLFRSIDTFDYADIASRLQSTAVQQSVSFLVQDRPRKRRKRQAGAVRGDGELRSDSTLREEERSQNGERIADFPSWLCQLLVSLAFTYPRDAVSSKAESQTENQVDQIAQVDRSSHGLASDKGEDLKTQIGPLPNSRDFQMILVMLLRYHAHASSHSGYPLAMAVHRRSYSLAHLLLLFGADPGQKDGLAVQIAIRNGFLDILHLLVSEKAHAIGLPPFADNKSKIIAPSFSLDHTHLRLAIQCRQWDVVDYIWHERNVSPDIACLRLLEKLKH